MRRLLITFVLLAATLAVMPQRSAYAYDVQVHREPPQVPNLGVAPKPLRFVAVIPTKYPHATKLAKFVKYLPQSQWLAALQQEYPPAPGSPPNKPQVTVMMVDDMKEPFHHQIPDFYYQDYVYDASTAAAAPNYQTIYVLFLRCQDGGGMDTAGCNSHHPPMVSNRVHNGHDESSLYTEGDTFAAVLEPGDFPTHTQQASHEIAEAYTDTDGLAQWELQTATPNHPWKDQPPWLKQQGTVELADIAGDTRWYETDGGRTYRFTRVFANSRAQAGLDDPYVPVSPYPVFGVSSPLGDQPHDWFKFTLPSAIDVPMTAWAAADSVGTFNVKAKLLASGGDDPNFCTSLPRSVWTVSNSVTFHFRVNPPASVHPGTSSWCTFRFESFQTNGPADADEGYFWGVGLHLSVPESTPT
ncbi:MAG TPA: hypothetical protein VHC63_06830 [Acidimicrobiales bacterium]|nr:hypothetical protein [Acidimicrobiales bacterium]